MSNRMAFSDYEKKTVYAKYNGCCALCGKPVKFKELTIDHKTPLSKGGGNDMANLQLSCRRCNLSKSDMMDDEWLGMIWDLFWHNFKDIVKVYYINAIRR